MVYTKILFNNIKEYTPSFIRTIPYSQITKTTLGRKPQIVSKFNADPKVKRFWRFFQRHIQKNPTLFQVYIFLNSFVIFHLCYDSWLFLYRLNNQHRSLDAAIATEKEFKRKQREQEEAAGSA
eukprot:TRINITY_DN0_c219_g1_i2.p1 TRINITY_DN0_c219_g1~~TRINITY_DN0_c219_g1_i2.p1  ORF type:complete len:123 (+),score=39.84 TRINITY_DN0_c219_g1_i2:44-412(+)